MSRQRLTFYFILGWFLVTLGWFIPQAVMGLRLYPLVLGLDLEEKKHELEGDLYAAAKACEREVPSTEPLFLYAGLAGKGTLPINLSPSLRLAHDCQKLSYFLYPRRVYWEGERVKEPIRYVLVYHAELTLSGFRHLADVTDTIYLLKREEE